MRTALSAPTRGSLPEDIDFVQRARDGHAHQRRRRDEVDVRGLRRAQSPHLERQEHARPLHGSRERARGDRLRHDAGHWYLPAHHRLRDARPRVRQRVEVVVNNVALREGRYRPQQLRWRSADTTPVTCFARPGVLPERIRSSGEAARRLASRQQGKSATRTGELLQSMPRQRLRHVPWRPRKLRRSSERRPRPERKLQLCSCWLGGGFRSTARTPHSPQRASRCAFGPRSVIRPSPCKSGSSPSPKCA